jgi:hypothetical protein
MALLSSISAWWSGKGRPFADIAEFRQLIMMTVERRHLAENVVADPVDPAKFAMTVHGDSSTVDLTNIYGYINAYPEQDSGELIDRFVRSITEDHDKPVADESIVAVVRSREYVDSMGQDILHEPLGADLVVLHMADLPDSMAPITKADVPGKDLAAVREIALGNIRQWLPKVVSDDSLGDGVLYYVEGNTMLSTSLILLEDFWTSVAARFPGDVLIALPRKDQLFLFDDDGNARSLARIRQLIDATIEDNFNLLSPQLYARRGGAIVAATE